TTSMGQQGFVCPLVGRAAMTTAKGELMFWRIIGRLACIVVVSFSQAPAGAARAHCEDEIELALAAIGSGSAEGMKSRLISERITVFDDLLRAQARAALPAALPRPT